MQLTSYSSTPLHESPAGERLPDNRSMLGLALLALALVAMAWWNLTAEQRFYNDRSSVPSAVDHFLASVRAATPAHATLLIADTWQNNVMFVRALYMLQPRRLVLLPVRSSDLTHGLLALTWSGLQRRAHQSGARYAALYAIPDANPRELVNGWLVPAIPQGAIPQSAVRLRDGRGVLVELPG